MLDARRIRAVAETDARSLVDESELVKIAKKRGDEIVAEAQERAARLLQAVEVQVRKKQSGGDQFAQDSLAQLEEQVLNLLNVIHAGQRILTPSEDTETAPASDGLEANKAS